jgi:hypothetical protein
MPFENPVPTVYYRSPAQEVNPVAFTETSGPVRIQSGPTQVVTEEFPIPQPPIFFRDAEVTEDYP